MSASSPESPWSVNHRRLCVLLAMRVLCPKLKKLREGLLVRCWALGFLSCSIQTREHWAFTAPGGIWDRSRPGWAWSCAHQQWREGLTDEKTHKDGHEGQPVGLLTHCPEGHTAHVCGPNPDPDSQDPKRQCWQIYILLRKKASIQQQSQGSSSPRKAFSQPGHKRAEAQTSVLLPMQGPYWYAFSLAREPPGRYLGAPEAGCPVVPVRGLSSLRTEV